MKRRRLAGLAQLLGALTILTVYVVIALALQGSLTGEVTR